MEYIKWLSDNPIESIDEDILQFKDAANVLTQMIVSSDTPFTIGINGEWGSGKTSLMRLIEANVKKIDTSEIRTSWFDTWKYANEEEIWKLLMISLIEDLKLNDNSKYNTEELISSVINIGLMTVNASMTGGISLFTNGSNFSENVTNLLNSKKTRGETILKDKSKSIKNFRLDFENLVEKSVGEEGKYIIFIDDLDRVHPHKTIDVIESIKNFLSCKKCVFVIGCDYNYLNACIEKKYNGLNFDGKEYIEKVIQITYEVSDSNVHQFNIFLKKHLEPLFINKEDFHVASNLIHKSVGKNPRKIKRLINLYSIVHNLNNRGLDTCLLLKLICFIERWPEIHKKLLNDFSYGVYSYKKYEEWATPILIYEDYFGYEYPPKSTNEDEFEPPNENEMYDDYLENKKETVKKINDEFNLNKIDIENETLKSFLSAPPLFPHKKDDFAPYLSLVKSIDLNTVKTIEENVMKDLPSVNDINNIFKDVKNRFDGQEVDGRYFSVNNKVILPTKEPAKKDSRFPNVVLPIGRIGNLGSWEYIIVDSKYDDRYFFNLISKFDENKKHILWIISPWGFPKSVKSKVKKIDYVYLSSYYLLDDLNNHFSSNPNI